MKLNSGDIDIPATSVSVYDAIFRRRNVKAFTDEPVSRDALERLFAAAIWAPNHRLTEPTRFFVVPRESSTRRRLGDIAWRTTYDGVANPDPDRKRRAAEDSRDRVVGAPAMVYVYSLPGENEEMTRENYASSCCAVQNMALAAVAEGLSLGWSTGRLARLPGLARLLGADEDWTMVGVVFLGRAEASAAAQRTPHRHVVSWLE